MAFASIVIGLLLIALFAYSNFYLDEQWASLASSARPASGSAQRAVARGGTIRGSVEGTIFMAGVVLVTFGVVAIGTSFGYGGF